MKKVFGFLAIVVALVFAASSTTSAQQTFGNAGLEVALPVGDWSEDLYPLGVGGSGGIELGISDNFAITANAGIIFMALDDGVSDLIASSFLVPVQVGGRFYLDQQRSGLFVEAKAGMHLQSVTTEDFEFLGETVEGESESEVFFSIAPQVGFFLNENISLALRYQIALVGDEDVETVNPITGETSTESVERDNIGYIGLKVAYNF
ncbi:MAG TPA: outer membrane beta-barrel protein [Cryomorphaceae bacterium]|nr:outer membrane beta-barrel protein [Cryomorphaceae bacterium]